MINKNIPKVSIIINSYKDLYKLKSCLNSIRETQYNNIEIIVVSYGIQKKDIEKSKANSYVDKLILLKKDLGPPAQRNIGFKARNLLSKYTLFIDNDVLLTNITIDNLVRVLEKYPKIGAAQPLLLNSNQFVDCAGAHIDNLGYTYILYRGKHVSNFNIKEDYLPISYASSACLLLRVSYYSKEKYFQPFDDEFYFNYEDADLSLRSWGRGIKVVCIPSAVAIHERGRTSTLNKSPNHLVFLNTRNKFITLTSIFNLKMLLTSIPLFIFFEFIKAIRLFKINLSHSLSTLLAIYWCLRNLRKIYLRRKIILKTALWNKNLLTVINKPHFSTLIQAFKSHYKLT